MNKIKARSEVDNKYKWDLSLIYSGLDEFNDDYIEVENKLKKLSSYENTMLNSAKDLYTTTTEILKNSRIIEKMYVYAHLTYNEDITKSSSIELLNKIENLNIKFSQTVSYYDSKLLSLDYDVIEKMYEEYPKLKEYETYFNKSFRYKKYMLSEIEEKLLAKMQKAIADNETIFSNLTDSDINFGYITDENGNKVELTNTNFSLFIKSKDRRVRQDAFKTLYGVYKQYKTTLSNCLEKEIKTIATLEKIRGYQSSLDAAMYSNELPIKVFDSLIESVNNGLEPLYKYFRLKKEILNIKDFHIYDTYANLIEKYDKKYSYEDAQKIIKDVLKVFGSEYSSYVDKAFSEHWIDAMPNKGKTSGAFSGGGYDTNPYILTNFQEEFNDVSTLIHEIGHSIHSYYSRNNNPYVYSQYSIVVAEVASTVNELLLARYIIDNSKDIEERLYVMDRLMSLFKSTIYRQTMYEEFERFLYEKVEKEESLTSDIMCDEFYKLNQKYFGDDVIIDDEIKYEWERMPHLYYNFYMYKYATGLSAACYIVNSILLGKKDAVKNYIEFLKQGGKIAPNEQLKITGVDLTKKEICDNAIKMFSDLVDEFERTYNEYKRSGGGYE